MLVVNHKVYCQKEIYFQVFNNHNPQISLNDYLFVVEENERLSDIASVKEYLSFKPFKQSEKFDKSTAYWGKMLIKSELSETKKMILALGAKRHSDIADIYLLDESNTIIKQVKSGHFVKQSEKEVKKELGSKCFIELEPGKLYKIFVRIENISGFTPSFDIKLTDYDKLEEKVSLRNLVQGGLQGALLIMFLYNLFIFVYSRDKVYLYYSLYILGIALNFVIERGLFKEYTIPETPRLEPYAFILATGLATIAYFQFVRYFLNTKKHMPKWDLAHLWVVRINIGVTVALLALLLISFNIPVSINVSNYMNLIGLFYGFVFIYYLIRYDNKLSRFFIAGAFVLAGGTFVSLYFLISKNPLSFDPKYFMNMATILEILIFSLGLGYRLKLIEKSKQEAQKELIEQLKQNERLKERINRELEEKVKERTLEIELQKEELLASSETLKTANDILINQKREIEVKNEEITLQKKYLEKVHKGTTDSINYASRLQKVILPSENLLQKYFSEHFIFYQPKEIVSGDFYWYRYIERNGRRYFALVAADSTGHGVPGSLVSMLGISLLNETVIRNRLEDSNIVLEMLRRDVKATFSHSDENLLTKDGIDMAFCLIDLDSLEMQYAGANRPLLLIKQNGQEEKTLLEYKPTKSPIGTHHKEYDFENHVIQLEKGDKIYLCSDGYADQVGGPDGRKYYFKRFKELLVSIHEKSMEEQKEIIIKTHNDWIEHEYKGEDKFKQVDDILVMGVKV